MPEAQEGYCHMHDENTAAINKQKGMWTVLLVIVAGAIVGGWYFLDRIDQNVSRMAASTAKMDKVLTGYMAGNSQRINEINHRIDRCEESDADHELRLRALELKR